jgi:hypothetical protein
VASSKILTPTPLTARWEDILAGWRGGGWSIVRKTPDTALYSIYVSTLQPHYLLLLFFQLLNDDMYIILFFISPWINPITSVPITTIVFLIGYNSPKSQRNLLAITLMVTLRFAYLVYGQSGPGSRTQLKQLFSMNIYSYISEFNN